MKAIETHYKGYRFRSRLEARWAVFFDALEIRWRYETEGFVIGQKDASFCYLPDFYLPDWDCFLEIKPDLPHSEVELFDQSGCFVMPLYGGKDATSLQKFVLASLELKTKNRKSQQAQIAYVVRRSGISHDSRI